MMPLILCLALTACETATVEPVPTVVFRCPEEVPLATAETKAALKDVYELMGDVRGGQEWLSGAVRLVNACAALTD